MHDRCIIIQSLHEVGIHPIIPNIHRQREE